MEILAVSSGGGGNEGGCSDSFSFSIFNSLSQEEIKWHRHTGATLHFTEWLSH